MSALVNIFNLIKEPTEQYSNTDEANKYFDEFTSQFDSTDIDQHITVDGKEYRIIHGTHIEQAFADEIEQYVDDCVLPEIPEYLHRYFDLEAFTEDARYDGYGHHFSSYDGSEESTDDYYIFRTN